jgi:hypothetical protein
LIWRECSATFGLLALLLPHLRVISQDSSSLGIIDLTFKHLHAPSKLSTSPAS